MPMLSNSQGRLHQVCCPIISSARLIQATSALDLKEEMEDKTTNETIPSIQPSFLDGGLPFVHSMKSPSLVREPAQRSASLNRASTFSSFFFVHDTIQPHYDDINGPCSPAAVWLLWLKTSVVSVPARSAFRMWHITFPAPCAFSQTTLDSPSPGLVRIG